MQVTSTRCTRCGMQLTPGSQQGLCAECLAEAARQTHPISKIDETVAETGDAEQTSSADAISPEAGSRLRYFGDYELLEKIAQGGMGVVWKARQSSLKRDVALKMIRTGALAGPTEIERFHREAQAAANLQHPNIVAIHEVGEHGGQHYFSMDYVEGRDLGAIAKDGPLQPRRAAGYVRIIAEAVDYAHQRGTLHRDLKPQNVLVDCDDRLRITDFGLAKLLNDDSGLTLPGIAIGSPSYMPPEQAVGRHGEIGPVSDVYSIGAILYELLTGRPPFRGATVMDTLREVLEVEPLAPRRLKADIPIDLETICLRCLEKSPSSRYPDASALAVELGRFLNGEPILSRRAGAVRKAVSWGRGHPLFLSGLEALLVVALAFLAFYLFEEDAFLRARIANPSLARSGVSYHQSLQNAMNACRVLAVIDFPLLAIVLGRGRGVGLRQLFDRQWPLRPLQPLDWIARTTAAVLGVTGLGLGVLLLAREVRASVWEGGARGAKLELSWALFFWGYCTIFAGIGFLNVLIRDYRLIHYGFTGPVKFALDRESSAEQIPAAWPS